MAFIFTLRKKGLLQIYKFISFQSLKTSLRLCVISTSTPKNHTIVDKPSNNKMTLIYFATALFVIMNLIFPIRSVKHHILRCRSILLARI